MKTRLISSVGPVMTLDVCPSPTMVLSESLEGDRYTSLAREAHIIAELFCDHDLVADILCNHLEDNDHLTHRCVIERWESYPSWIKADVDRLVDWRRVSEQLIGMVSSVGMVIL